MRLCAASLSGTSLASLILKEAFLASQLFAKKSIDKLISDSERPGHRLPKSLGPWSLTALGIGAIIGSGIFVLTGTAAAGEYSTPSLLHAQVLDVFQNLFQHGNLSGVLLHGRPPAGPAIALSFLLVAIACSFAAWSGGISHEPVSKLMVSRSMLGMRSRTDGL